MKTTLNDIRDCKPCSDSWKKLLTYLGKTAADDEPLSISGILDSNGLDDALWCLRAVKGYEKEMRLFAVWCVRRIQYLNTDPRIEAALVVAEGFANGSVTENQLYRAGFEVASIRPRDNVCSSAEGTTIVFASFAAAVSASSAVRAAAATGAEEHIQAFKLRRLCAEIDARV